MVIGMTLAILRRCIIRRSLLFRTESQLMQGRSVACARKSPCHECHCAAGVRYQDWRKADGTLQTEPRAAPFALVNFAE